MDGQPDDGAGNLNFVGTCTGDGIVTFETEEDATAALSLGGYNLDGREMLVRFDRQKEAE